MLWDLNDDKQLHTLEHNDIITALCFSPNRYWLCAAYGPSVKIWVSSVVFLKYFELATIVLHIVISFQDLESKEMVEELKPEVVNSSAQKTEPPQCLSLAWSTDGQTLFAGYSDNMIRVWQVSVSSR